MGTDIDVYTEVKRNGVWHSVDTWTNIHGYDEIRPQFYEGRNYVLFAVLADCCMLEDIPGITEELRGIPNDMSIKLKMLWVWKENFHCRVNWVTLKEILDYPWDMKYKVEDVYMKPEDADHYRQTGEIRDWKKIYNPRYDENAAEYSAYLPYVEMPLSFACSKFLEETVPRLQALDPNPENVRIICGLDQ
jgi:hypothetical protein